MSTLHGLPSFSSPAHPRSQAEVAVRGLNETLAIGDRLRGFLKIRDFIASLGLTIEETLALTKMAIELFQNFTVDGIFAFIDALIAAFGDEDAAGLVRPKITANSASVQAIPVGVIFALLQMLLKFALDKLRAHGQVVSGPGPAVIEPVAYQPLPKMRPYSPD